MVTVGRTMSTTTENRENLDLENIYDNDGLYELEESKAGSGERPGSPGATSEGSGIKRRSSIRSFYAGEAEK